MDADSVTTFETSTETTSTKNHYMTERAPLPVLGSFGYKEVSTTGQPSEAEFDQENESVSKQLSRKELEAEEVSKSLRSDIGNNEQNTIATSFIMGFASIESLLQLKCILDTLRARPESSPAPATSLGVDLLHVSKVLDAQDGKERLIAAQQRIALAQYALLVDAERAQGEFPADMEDKR